METDAAFLLRVLSDGRPHTLNEILQASLAERGCGITVHSRASDLRKQGYRIVNETVPGAKRGAASTYRLIQAESTKRDLRAYPPELVHGELCATRFGANAVCDCGKEPVLACVVDESAGQAEQLALTDSAAAHLLFRDMAGTPL